MGSNDADLQADFQRRPGGRPGCGCCGFWLAGLLAVLALPALLILLRRVLDSKQSIRLPRSLLPLAGLAANTLAILATRSWLDANHNFVPDCDLASSAANGECGAMPATFGQPVISTNIDPTTGMRIWPP